MEDFPFNWQLTPIKKCHQYKNRYISRLKINPEWSLVCMWSTVASKPAVLEIHRYSTAQEIQISGTFELMCGSMSLLRRDFTGLIEAGLATMELKLEYSGHCFGPYSIIGTLTIPAAQKEDPKRIQFQSLLALSSDFERLLDPKATNFSDVNLKCGAVSFHAHKNILSTRSPVFAAMFSTQMKENLSNEVDIADLAPHTLETMLTYLYTGKTEDLSVQSADELLFAADKYQLKDLKRVCCEYLKIHVSTLNIVSILVLGYLHDQDLKDFAMDFICNNTEEFEVLEQTAEWKILREKRPSLAMDVLTSLVKSKDKKLKER